jgi:hypothetical protein
MIGVKKFRYESEKYYVVDVGLRYQECLAFLRRHGAPFDEKYL